MSVAGYNIDPESSDPVVGVELEGDRACLYIGQEHSTEEIKLERHELIALIRQAREVIDQLDWNSATWLYAHGIFNTDKYHLVRKGERDPQGKAICGKLPPHKWGKDSERYDWKFSPVIGEPISSSVCKSCSEKWQKINK